MERSNSLPNEHKVKLAEKEEARFLGILLRDKDKVSEAISFGIAPTPSEQPGHFMYPKNSYLYMLIKKYFLEYGALLTRSAMDSLMDRQEGGTDEERASMKSYWDKIWNRNDVDDEDFRLLMTSMNDRYVEWQFYERWKLGDEIFKKNSSSIDMIKEFIGDVNSLKNVNPDSYSLTMNLEDGIKRAMDYVIERRENPIEPDRVMTGIQALDEIYNGFEKGSYTVVSGMINGGKTTLLMNIGFNMAKAGYNVAYVSMEKKADLFYRRLLSNHAATDYNRIKRGGKEEWGITDHWLAKLQEGARDLLENIKPHYDCLQFVQGTVLTKILAELDKLRTMKKLDVIIVDYLGVIGFESKTIGRPDLDLAKIHQRLQAYGKEHDLVTLTALQLKSSSSKDIRKKAQKVGSDADVSSVEVNTEDYSGSQIIIADADNAIGCVLNADHPPTKMYISISKARDAESRRTITLDFDGKLGRVADPEYTPQQIKATHDLLYDSNVDNAQLEQALTSDDDLFTSVSDSEGSDVEGESPQVPTAPKPDIFDELDEAEPEIITEKKEEDILPDLGEIDGIDDGSVDDIFGTDELGS